MIIPKHIYNVLNDKSGFDALFMHHLKSTDNAEGAYLAAVEEVNKYVPFKEPYNGYDSYKSKLALTFRKEVFVPDDVALAAVKGIYDLFYKFYGQNMLKQQAYNKTMAYINKHLPNHKPYKNYQSFRSSLRYRRVSKVMAKRKKRGA